MGLLIYRMIRAILFHSRPCCKTAKKCSQILPPCTCGTKSGKHSPSSGTVGCLGGGGGLGTMASSKSSGVSSAASEPFYLHIPPPTTPSSASSDDNSGSGGGGAATSDGKQRVYLTFSSSVVSGSSDRGAVQCGFCGLFPPFTQ